ncbi:MAG: hypothetical protein ACJARS_002906, partial [bacterium]
MAETGRPKHRILGPSFDVIHGAGTTELRWHARYQSTAGFLAALDKRHAYLVDPGTDGIAPLVEHTATALVYRAPEIRTLSEWMASTGGDGVGLKAAMQWLALSARSVATAVEPAWAHGIRGHGNIGPWRCAIDEQGLPVLLGYGLPAVEHDVYDADETVVPPADAYRYRSPEQLNGEDIDESSDVYALVLLAVELGTGLSVYDGTAGEVADQAFDGQGPERLPELPMELDAVLLRALDVLPGKRHETALDFAEELEVVIDGLKGVDLDEAIFMLFSKERNGGLLADPDDEERAQLAAIVDVLVGRRSGAPGLQAAREALSLDLNAANTAVWDVIDALRARTGLDEDADIEDILDAVDEVERAER